MPHPAGFARLALFALPVICCLALVGAAPPQTDSPEELVRRANEAFRAGDVDGADKLYAAAEERTTDPGLVAFNRGAVLFDRAMASPTEKHLFRDAEKQYERVLDDAACPPERAAKAWFNRGTCLLARGGTLGVYRSAIACFEHTLDSPAADTDLKRRAAHNLELAKLRWNEERKKAAKPEEESPNKKLPPEEEHQPRPEPERPGGGTEQNPGNETTPGGQQPQTGMQPQQVPLPKNGDKPTPTEQKTAGNNQNLQVPEDKDEVQKLSPEEARAYLQETAKRRKRELHSMLETLYGPDRPNVRDW
jgi:hypothetical protein